MTENFNKDEKMPDNVNGELELCPLCESEMEWSNDGGHLVHSTYNDSCPLGIPLSVDVDAWNNRPGEDAARLKQFEEDCKVMCNWCKKAPAQLDSHGDWVHPNEHYQDWPCLAADLRSVWEECHNRKEEHGI